MFRLYVANTDDDTWLQLSAFFVSKQLGVEFWFRWLEVVFQNTAPHVIDQTGQVVNIYFNAVVDETEEIVPINLSICS